MLNALLQRAKSDLCAADYLRNTGDEFDLCLVAYHIQQAIEKGLKQCLESLGISYPKIHRIADLVNQLPDSQQYLSSQELYYLLDKADTSTAWEANTRYTEGYFSI